jgi:hypothetical protein
VDVRLTCVAHPFAAVAAVASLHGPVGTACRQVHISKGAPLYSQPLCSGSKIQDIPFCTRVDYLQTGVQSCGGICWIEVLFGGQSRWLLQAEPCGSDSTVANCTAKLCSDREWQLLLSSTHAMH